MPSLPIEASQSARDIALTLITRASGSRGSSRVGRPARTGMRVLSGGIIAAIVIGSLVGLALIILAILLFRRHKRQSQARNKEMQKYYGDNRSSIGSTNYGGDYNNTTTTNNGGYNYGQGYGYAHTAAPGQYGYAPRDNGGVSGVAPAHTADHVTTK
ncbi:uncharacterized protein CTRU02_202604 [Colletotrichum truncatum]|uniref:Uncharacterized protein n=1 Tax=Colletotrichum truncatum TaxID=5467 RepID=A0ACC3ZKP8_COLTU|nr:uncharacterized protein CTRU02_01773 [Colletotrichum truncatum]KAF6800094.1 hypothetical protein CTRU02_01773 [Colletotrichum truncatum]